MKKRSSFSVFVFKEDEFKSQRNYIFIVIVVNNLSLFVISIIDIGMSEGKTGAQPNKKPIVLIVIMMYVYYD